MFSDCIFPNMFFNKLLKTIIREPRPSDQLFYADFEKLNNEERFGMPSGHLQSIGYSFGFLYFMKRPTPLLLTALFFGSITAFQRYKFHRHSIAQLTMGSLIGFSVSYLFFSVTENLLTIHGHQ